MMCWKSARLSKILVRAGGDDNTIPKVFVKAGKFSMEETMVRGDDGDDQVVRNIYRKLLRENDGYKIHFFDDDSMTEFMYQHFGNCKHRSKNMSCWCGRVWLAYRTVIPGAFKADLFRFSYLYIYGGVWTDLTQELHLKVGDIIGKNADGQPIDTLVEDLKQGGCYYRPGVQISFMAIRRHSELIYKFLHNAVSNIINKNMGVCPLDITGPVACARVLLKYDKSKYRISMFQTRDNEIMSLKKNAIEKFTPAITCRAKTHRNTLDQDGSSPHYSELYYNNQVFADVGKLDPYVSDPDLTFTIATYVNGDLELQQSAVSSMRDIENPEYEME